MTRSAKPTAMKKLEGIKTRPNRREPKLPWLNSLFQELAFSVGGRYFGAFRESQPDQTHTP